MLGESHRGRSVPDLGSWSLTWVVRIAELYHRYNRRQAAHPDAEAWPRADQALRAWVAQLKTHWQKELRNPALPSRAAKVLRTVQRQWDGLTRFMDDPRIPLDNNTGERKIWNPVTQRKNYYGSRAIWSGKLAAQCWTIGATAAQNGIDPQAWLTAYLSACAENGGQPLTADALARFLPWALSDTDRVAWAAPQSAVFDRLGDCRVIPRLLLPSWRATKGDPAGASWGVCCHAFLGEKNQEPWPTLQRSFVLSAGDLRPDFLTQFAVEKPGLPNMYPRCPLQPLLKGAQFRGCSIRFRPSGLHVCLPHRRFRPSGCPRPPRRLHPSRTWIVTAPCMGYANHPNRPIGDGETCTPPASQPCRLLLPLRLSGRGG